MAWGGASTQLEQPDATHATEPPMGPVFVDTPQVDAARPAIVREVGDFDGDGARELGIIDSGSGGQVKHYLAAFSVDRQLRGIVDADTGLGVTGVLSAASQLADVNGDGRA